MTNNFRRLTPAHGAAWTLILMLPFVVIFFAYNGGVSLSGFGLALLGGVYLIREAGRGISSGRAAFTVNNGWQTPVYQINFADVDSFEWRRNLHNSAAEGSKRLWVKLKDGQDCWTSVITNADWSYTDFMLSPEKAEALVATLESRHQEATSATR